MNKKFKIGCLSLIIAAVLFFIVGIAIQKWNDAPSQSFTFINTANVTRSVTFERIEKDGKLADLYTIDNEIKPNKEAYEQVPAGKYKISVWNQDKTLYNSVEFEVKLKDPKKSDYQMVRFDLAMDKIFAIVNLNALYEGKSFAEHMSKAAGTQREKLRIEKFYDGSSPFFVPETFTFRTFVDMNDKIPAKVKYGEIVYGLFAFPKTQPEDEIETAIFSQISEKIK